MESSSSPVNHYPPDNPSGFLLLDQAQSSAKHIVCEWIRATLYEAFVQALQKTWTVTTTTKEVDVNSTNGSHVNPNGATTPRVEISQDALQRAQGFVSRLAQTWEQKLRQSDQRQVAEWLRQVLDLGKATLWRKQQDVVVPDKGQVPTVDIDDSSRRPSPPTAAVVPPSSPAPQNNDTAKNHQTPQLAFTRLRRLGARAAPPSTATWSSGSSALETDPAESALATIREMGRNGETYWPLDWQPIDTIIDQIPTRLHADKKTTHSLNSSGDRVEPPPKFTVIPKGLWEKQQRQQQQAHHEQDVLEGQQVGDSLVDDTAALALLVDQQRHEPASKRRKKSSHHKTSIPDEEPRPPSDISNKKYIMKDIIASFSPLQRKQVDRLLHPEDDANQQQHHHHQGHHDAASPLVLFGALKSVGHTHYHLQREHDKNGPTNVRDQEDNKGAEDETNSVPQTTFAQEVDRFRRQEAGWAFLERLGRNEVEANVDPRRFRSKILRTVGRDNRDEHWWELDIGECILEVRLNDEECCKRLCAFSSLELLLREGVDEEEDAQTS
jgi:hypothetical protein